MTYTSAPLSTMKSIVAATWPEFIKELKQSVKDGKQEVHRLLYQDNYFKCLLVDGKNEGFVKCLDGITGNEVNCLELIDKLQEAASMKATEQNTSTETPSSTVNTVEKRRENGVEVALVKSKPSRAKRGSKGGQQ